MGKNWEGGKIVIRIYERKKNLFLTQKEKKEKIQFKMSHRNDTFNCLNPDRLTNPANHRFASIGSISSSICSSPQAVKTQTLAEFHGSTVTDTSSTEDTYSHKHTVQICKCQVLSVQ